MYSNTIVTNLSGDGCTLGSSFTTCREETHDVLLVTVKELYACALTLTLHSIVVEDILVSTSLSYSIERLA